MFFSKSDVIFRVKSHCMSEKFLFLHTDSLILHTPPRGGGQPKKSNYEKENPVQSRLS